MTLVFPYYNNPRMLARQVECWNTYEGLPVKVILVDDGSQHPAHVETCKVPIEVYRITEDIPWNCAGARNLGCSQADGWIHVSDIDTLLYREDLEQLLNCDDPECFYQPRHVYLPEHRPLKPRINILAFHKSKFDEIGGYDEDYCGHYGREVTDFYHRMQSMANLVTPDVTVRMVPPFLIADACTVNLDRNIDRNTELFISKRAAGFPKPKAGLRFTWHRVA